MRNKWIWIGVRNKAKDNSYAIPNPNKISRRLRSIDSGSIVKLVLALSKTKQSEKIRPLALSKRLNRESSHLSKGKNARMMVMVGI